MSTHFPEYSSEQVRTIDHAGLAAQINHAKNLGDIIAVSGMSGAGKTTMTETIIPARAAAWSAVNNKPCVVHDNAHGLDAVPTDVNYMVYQKVDCTTLTVHNVTGITWVDTSGDKQRAVQTEPGYVEAMTFYHADPLCVGGITVWDEFTNISDVSIHGALNQLFTHWSVGQFSLNPAWFRANWQNICAYNAPGDGASRTKMDTPMSARLVHYRVEPSRSELTKYMVAKGVAHPAVLHVLNGNGMFSRVNIRMPEQEHEVNAGGVANDKYHLRYVSARGWERLGKAMIYADRAEMDDTERTALLDGRTVSSAMTQEILDAVVVLMALPDISRVYADPLSVDMPTDHGMQNAVLTSILNGLDADMSSKNVAAVALYIQRANKEVQALAMRSLYAISQKPEFDWVDKDLWNILFGDAELERVNNIPVITETEAIRRQVFSKVQLQKVAKTLEEYWTGQEVLEDLEVTDVSSDDDEFAELDNIDL